MRRDALLLASRNRGKLIELRDFFARSGIAVIDLLDAEIPETPEEDAIEAYPTFEENALAKASYFASRSGQAVVADDSGLEVLALGGEPGVRSKRWSGRTDPSGAAVDAANNALLLERLRGVADRRARFVCAAAWCHGDERVVVRGEVPGIIVDAPSGTHGFGYDPYFFSTELGRTLGDATVAEKAQVSHRGRAFARLLDVLVSRGAIARS